MTSQYLSGERAFVLLDFKEIQDVCDMFKPTL